MRLPSLPFWIWPIGAALVVAGVAGAAWLPRYTTSDPTFCLTCHARGDTPDVGIPSQVHPGYDKVGCVECHVRTGHLFITNIYREGVEAEVERVSANCLRCHGDIASRDPRTFKFNALGIRMDHRFHLEVLGAECAYCHSNITHDWAERPTNRPRMEYCYQCHSRQATPCLQCHASGLPALGGAEAEPTPAAPAVGGEAQPTPALPPGQALYSRYCSACHGAQGGQFPGVDLGSADYLGRLGPAELAKAIAKGVPGMPGFGAEAGGPLAGEEVQALVEFLQSRAR